MKPSNLALGYFTGVMALLVVLAHLTPPKTAIEPVSCQKLLNEFSSVAAIANATGRVPGVVQVLPVKTVVTANPPCVASRGNVLVAK
jgi:hypothetical protein